MPDLKFTITIPEAKKKEVLDNISNLFSQSVLKTEREKIDFLKENILQHINYNVKRQRTIEAQRIVKTDILNSNDSLEAKDIT